MKGELSSKDSLISLKPNLPTGRKSNQIRGHSEAGFAFSFPPTCSSRERFSPNPYLVDVRIPLKDKFPYIFYSIWIKFSAIMDLLLNVSRMKTLILSNAIKLDLPTTRQV